MMDNRSDLLRTQSNGLFQLMMRVSLKHGSMVRGQLQGEAHSIDMGSSSMATPQLAKDFKPRVSTSPGQLYLTNLTSQCCCS